MSSTCVAEVNIERNHWYRIVHELLQKADIEINGSRPWDIQVKHPDFFKRVLQKGSLGLGESYMDGWWECERLDMFFHRALKHKLDEQLPHHVQDIVRIALARLVNLQSKKRAWQVGKAHYDLGNDLFTLMLDPYMQYSCGYWKDATTLEAAQEAKLDMICRKLQLKPGMTLLDIGCGWGGLAAYAARNYGVSVQGVTISAEQQKLAQQRCEGLDVTILLQDYRDLNQQFDRIVSVGMFEHVGVVHYREFFETVGRCLQPDGVALLHAIGRRDGPGFTNPWIAKYIFPGGYCPALSEVLPRIEQSGLIVTDIEILRLHYAETLRNWRRNFTAKRDAIASLYDERFCRMFEFYLCGAEIAFRREGHMVSQIQLAHQQTAVPLTRDYITDFERQSGAFSKTRTTVPTQSEG